MNEIALFVVGFVVIASLCACSVFLGSRGHSWDEDDYGCCGVELPRQRREEENKRNMRELADNIREARGKK